MDGFRLFVSHNRLRDRKSAFPKATVPAGRWTRWASQCSATSGAVGRSAPRLCAVRHPLPALNSASWNGPRRRTGCARTPSSAGGTFGGQKIQGHRADGGRTPAPHRRELPANSPPHGKKPATGTAHSCRSCRARREHHQLPPLRRHVRKTRASASPATPSSHRVRVPHPGHPRSRPPRPRSRPPRPAVALVWAEARRPAGSVPHIASMTRLPGVTTPGGHHACGAAPIPSPAARKKATRVTVRTVIGMHGSGAHGSSPSVPPCPPVAIKVQGELFTDLMEVA